MVEDEDTQTILSADADVRADVFNQFLKTHRARLLRMVSVRMHPKVRARVDASDVIQEAFIDAVKHLDAYVAEPAIPLFLWLRRMVGQRLIKAHRFHLDAKRRNARIESPARQWIPPATTFAMADVLSGDQPSPHTAAARADSHRRLLELIEELGDTDREVLAMRHLEEMSNEEVAVELGVSKHAASKRYIRALKRLKELADGDATA